MSRRPADLDAWPRPFDPDHELNWGDPVVSRRLLAEHLDTTHDGASRRPEKIASHIRRLRTLLPPPPTRVLDAACGPGLYAIPLAQAGYAVTGVDIGPAVIAHARELARRTAVDVDLQRADLRQLTSVAEFSAILLIYHVLESFPRREQVKVLRRLREALTADGLLLVEMRASPGQPPGRISSWDVVDRSLLSDEPHLLLTDTVWDDRARTFVLREIAVFDDGRTAAQQTTSRLCTLDDIPRLFERARLRVSACWDGWSRRRARADSEAIVVAARRA